MLELQDRSNVSVGSYYPLGIPTSEKLSVYCPVFAAVREVLIQLSSFLMV